MKRIALLSAALLLAMAYANAHPATNIASNYIRSKEPSRVEKKMDKKELRRFERKNDVSTLSIDKFNTDFGTLPNVEWTRSPYFDEARFIEKGKPTTAYFNSDGKLVGTTQNITAAKIPADGLKQIKRMYKNYMIDHVVYFKDNHVDDSNMLLYGTEYSHANNYFVELSKGSDKIIVQVTPNGTVYFFKQL